MRHLDTCKSRVSNFHRFREEEVFLASNQLFPHLTRLERQYREVFSRSLRTGSRVKEMTILRVGKEFSPLHEQIWRQTDGKQHKASSSSAVLVLKIFNMFCEKSLKLIKELDRSQESLPPFDVRKHLIYLNYAPVLTKLTFTLYRL